jgi:hypothetical protein
MNWYRLERTYTARKIMLVTFLLPDCGMGICHDCEVFQGDPRT